MRPRLHLIEVQPLCIAHVGHQADFCANSRRKRYILTGSSSGHQLYYFQYNLLTDGFSGTIVGYDFSRSNFVGCLTHFQSHCCWQIFVRKNCLDILGQGYESTKFSIYLCHSFWNLLQPFVQSNFESCRKHKAKMCCHSGGFVRHRGLAGLRGLIRHNRSKIYNCGNHPTHTLLLGNSGHSGKYSSLEFQKLH
jgi:hypothetical protein